VSLSSPLFPPIHRTISLQYARWVFLRQFHLAPVNELFDGLRTMCHLFFLDPTSCDMNAGSYMTLGVKKLRFHPKCFKCSVCQKALQGKAFFIDDYVVYCGEHYEEARKSKS
jgi:hypothetical protein